MNIFYCHTSTVRARGSCHEKESKTQTNKVNDGKTEDRHRSMVQQRDMLAETKHGGTDAVNTLPSEGRNSTGFFSCLVPMKVSGLDQGHQERP